MNLRDATIDDFPDILTLNDSFVPFRSPLSRERLEMLHQRSIYGVRP